MQWREEGRKDTYVCRYIIRTNTIYPKTNQCIAVHRCYHTSDSAVEWHSTRHILLCMNTLHHHHTPNTLTSLLCVALQHSVCVANIAPIVGNLKQCFKLYLFVFCKYICFHFTNILMTTIWFHVNRMYIIHSILYTCMMYA